jgi:hypothetical protein
MVGGRGSGAPWSEAVVAGHGRKKVDDILAEALACGGSAASAAQRANVSPRTVQRRLGQADFRAKIDALRQDMLERTAAMLTALGMEGCRSLHELFDKSIPPAVRLGAIRTALEVGCKLREHVDLAKRVSALEAEQRGPTTEARAAESP